MRTNITLRFVEIFASCKEINVVALKYSKEILINIQHYATDYIIHGIYTYVTIPISLIVLKIMNKRNMYLSNSFNLYPCTVKFGKRPDVYDE